MVSEYAIEDIERMCAEGLRPTPRDIIRLNALGCKVERSGDGEPLAYLPRCAFLGELVFREPTIGSEVWLADAGRAFNLDDEKTLVFLRAYSLTRDQATLPDPLDVKAVLAEVEKFKRDAAFATVRQIVAALAYVVSGSDATDGETAAEPADAKPADGEESQDACVCVGLLRQGVAYRIGTMDELRKHPPSVLEEMLTLAQDDKTVEAVRKGDHARSLGRYARTRDEIRKRLVEELEKPEDDAEHDKGEGRPLQPGG